MNSDKSNAIMNKLKLFLHRRWDATNSRMGMSNNVYRTFRLIDTDNNDIVSKDEFIEGIYKISGHVITRSECAIIYDIIDKDNNNRLTYKEFVRGLHKDMSPLRFNFINHIFDSIDKNKLGYFTAADLDYSSHPDVISGKSSPRTMAVSVCGDNKRQVSRKEFIDYYTDLSISIASDAYFIALVNNAYNCPLSWRRTNAITNQCANRANNI